MVCNHLNKGKRKTLNSNTIASYNSVNDEILDRCRIMLELVKTRVEFRDYHKIGLQTSVPDDLYWLTKLDRDNIYFSIKEQDDGNFKMNWCSYDTLDGYGDEEAIIPSDFINNFDEYYNKIKDEIEANNEIEKVKFAEYQAKQKLEALEAKQKEIEKMEAKLQADKAKIDQLKKIYQIAALNYSLAIAFKKNCDIITDVNLIKFFIIFTPFLKYVSGARLSTFPR